MKCKSTRSKYAPRASMHTETVTSWTGHSWALCRACMRSYWVSETLSHGLHRSLRCAGCGRQGEVWIAKTSTAMNTSYEQSQYASSLGRRR
jgi:hypothetical protein